MRESGRPRGPQSVGIVSGGDSGSIFAFAKDVLPKAMKDPASTTVDPASISHQYLFDTKDGQTGETISVYLV